MKTPAVVAQAILAASLFFLSLPFARAHYCGDPVIRCRPGDIITYSITSDRSEEGITLYSVFDQTDPQVAPVIYYTASARVQGQFWIQASEIGTNDIALFWSFPHPKTPASGFCLLQVRVTADRPPITAGNNPFSAVYGDPVNTYSGELVNEEPPDLALGGPMPLQFRRYYASRLQADGLVNSRLGNNWSHNFEWRAVLGIPNQALIVSPQGFRALFNKSGGNWILESPTWQPFQLVNSGDSLIFGDPRDSRLYTFNTNGLLTSVRDGKGNTHTLSYTNATYPHNDLLLSVSDGLGRTLTFDYLGAHQLAQVSDGTRTVTFSQVEVGSQFNLTRVTRPLGRTIRYTYDNSKIIGSLLTATTHPAGNPGYVQVYDSDARVVQQTRLNTNVTRFVYATQGFTTTVTNGAGGVDVYTHSPDGQLLSVTDPAGQSLALATNALGLRAGVTDRTGASFGIGFDGPSARPNAITNANGSVTAFTYTNRIVNGIVFRSLASVILPDGSREHFTYDALGNLIGHRDRAGNDTRMSYNARGQVLAVTNPLGGVGLFSYNSDGTLASHGDVETGTHVFQHDELRRPTNAVASDGRSIGLRFDAADRIVSITDERGNTTHFTYDLNDNRIAVTNAMGDITQFAFDLADRLSRVTDRLGRAVTYRYNALDQLVTLTSRSGSAAELGWDSRQRLISQTDPAGKAWTFDYDSEGAAVSVTDPLGHTTGFTRDPAGFLKAMKNALGQTTLFGRDALHRLNATLNPLGRLDQFDYESRGLLTTTDFPVIGEAMSEFNEIGLLSRIIDLRGNPWTFAYSPLGRLTGFVDPLNRTTTTTHDSRGRPRRFAYPDGSAQTNTYDSAGNLSQLDFSDGRSLTFSLDKLHRVTSAANLGLSYDAENRVIDTVSADVHFAAAHDAAGRLINVSYDNNALRVTYDYDSRDRLTQVSDNLTAAQVKFLYDDAGRLTNVVRANGVHGIYDLDAAGKVTRIREGAFLDLQYAFNSAGDITSLNATAPLLPPPTSQTNILAFDVAQQISSPGYTYDPRGRLTTSPGHGFAWNSASQLVRVDSVTNTYNGAGNLLTRTGPAGMTRYYYNHAIGTVPIMAEQNGVSRAFQRFYVWTPDGRLLYMIDATVGNAVSYYHFDLTGSTLALTSGAGTVTDAYAYSPYGRLLARTGANAQPFTYVGRYGVRAEVNGLYQMRARYYDSLSARFLSRDPLWPRPSDPFSLNPYGYAANNPMRFIDPSGTRTRAEGVAPVDVITRDQISRGSVNSVEDILQLTSRPNVDSSTAINLRGLGASSKLVLLNGRRPNAAGGDSFVDLNALPTSMIDRIEIVRDGASSLYGSDALSGVINIITRKTSFENGSALGWRSLDFKCQFEGNVSLGYNCKIIPEPPSIPQPLQTGGQVYLINIMPDFVLGTSYSAQSQARPLGFNLPLDGNILSGMMFWLPQTLVPRPETYVNGEVVHSKPWDFLIGAFLEDDFYDWLFDRGISPEHVYRDLELSIALGGSGGAYADFWGYRALAIPPVR